MAHACECICGVLCDLGVAQDQAAEQNAAMEGALLITKQEATEWVQSMAVQALVVVAITAAVMTLTAREEAAARERREVEAAARKASAAREGRKAQKAIAKREAEVRAMEEALAQERARKEAEEEDHQEAYDKAQADAVKRVAFLGRAQEVRRGESQDRG